MDSDDDLPPPPPARGGGAPVIDLDDDDDDDLPAPPGAAVASTHGVQISLDDDDSDDDLPPPPKPAVILADDDDDDDLPPPPKPTAIFDDSSDDDLPPPPKVALAQQKEGAEGPRAAPAASAPPGAPSGASPAAAVRTRAPAASVGGANRSRGATLRKKVASIYKDGFLFKQQPSWPYGNQKRWCVVQGRMLSYFESQSSTKPSGTLDLKGAKLVEAPENAKNPNSFGIVGIASGTSGPSSASGNLKGRLFIFSCSNPEDRESWMETITGVVSEPVDTDLHWFEKLARGVF